MATASSATATAGSSIVVRSTDFPDFLAVNFQKANEDLIAVELLDGDGRPTPPGVPSRRMLVTDLHKTSQPIVRYALNDIVTIRPEPCACGSSFR